MTKTATPNERLDAELTDALRAGGHRITAPRVLVHRHVRRSHSHVTPEQVHSALVAELPGLSPATVYSTLELLRDLGFVRRVATPGGGIVYDPRAEPHHHLVCRRCGRVEDIDADISIAPARRAAQATGFNIEHAELQLSGLCRRCRISAPS